MKTNIFDDKVVFGVICLTFAHLISPSSCKSCWFKQDRKMYCIQCDSLQDPGCVNLTDPAIKLRLCKSGSLLTDLQQSWRDSDDDNKKFPYWGCQRIITSEGRVIRRCAYTSDGRNPEDPCRDTDFPLDSLRTSESISECFLHMGGDEDKRYVKWVVISVFVAVGVLFLGVFLCVLIARIKDRGVRKRMGF